MICKATYLQEDKSPRYRSTLSDNRRGSSLKSQRNRDSAKIWFVITIAQPKQYAYANYSSITRTFPKYSGILETFEKGLLTSKDPLLINSQKGVILHLFLKKLTLFKKSGDEILQVILHNQWYKSNIWNLE